MSIKYRKDIDGLRAFAVLIVVIFHFFPSILRNGFIGVDVFFVISGFLITKIVRDEISLGSFNYADFYSRRANRLFPSLIFVLISTLTTGLLFLYDSELKILLKHLAGGVLFFSNFIYAGESGYFDHASELKPLLHLWSLSIEEQFYFIWPLVLILSSKIRKTWVPLLICFFISFGLNFGHARKVELFYFPQYRFWEMILGGLLTTVTIPRSKRFQNILSVVGFFLLLIGLAVIKKNVAYPRLSALWPTVGAACLILAGPQGVFNRFLLSFRPIVYIGLISYPLYLWHWPIHSFHSMMSVNDHILIKILLMLLSVLMAIFTYEFIEKPLRKFRHNKQVPLFFSGVLLIIASFGMLNPGSGILEERHLGYEHSEVTKKQFRGSLEGSDFENCISRIIKMEFCAIHDVSKPPTILLVGDSHANHHFSSLRYSFGPEENVLLLAKSGTPALIGVTSLRESPTTNDDIFDYISLNPSIHTVILSSYWESYYEEKGSLVNGNYYKNRIQDKKNPDELDQRRVFLSSLKQTVEFVQKRKRTVIFIHDVPPLPFFLNKCSERRFLGPRAEECKFSRNIAREELDYRQGTEGLLKKLLVMVLDPLPHLCDASYCYVKNETGFIYSDEHHIGINGTQYLMKKMITSSRGVAR